jgi:hypothetical protein
LPLQFAVLLLLPEAKRVALEDVHLKFKQHWLWRSFMQPQQQQQAQQHNQERQQYDKHGHHQHNHSASSRHDDVHRPRLHEGTLQGPGKHASGAAAAAAAQPQQQLNVSTPGVLPDHGSAAAGHINAASQQEGSSSSMLGAFAAHAQQLPLQVAHAASSSREASRGLSMQPAGTLSFDLEEFMYGRR